jgi:hypothetical protein
LLFHIVCFKVFTHFTNKSLGQATIEEYQFRIQCVVLTRAKIERMIEDVSAKFAANYYGKA